MAHRYYKTYFDTLLNPQARLSPYNPLFLALVLELRKAIMQYLLGFLLELIPS